MRQLTVYWKEEEEGPLMEKLEKVAKWEKRSKSAVMLVALKEYIKRCYRDYGFEEDRGRGQ